MPCIFCGADAKLSREHVFPQWLRALFPDLGEADYLRRIVTFSTDTHHLRPGPSFDVVVRDVCRDCNHGWMEKLEARARPILTPMLQDDPRVLTAPEQHVVATWATKTMLTMQGANIGGERIVGLDRYHWFYENQTPLSVSYVWLCRYSDRTRWPLSIHQWGMTIIQGAEGSPSPNGAMNGFGVAFAVGPLAFWLFGYDLPGDVQTRAGSDDSHLLIWPAVGPDVCWPPRQTLEREAQLDELAQRMPTGTHVHGKPSVPPLRAAP